MDFQLNEEQQLLRSSVVRYLAESGNEMGMRWPQFASFGWLAVGIPESYGGLGRSPVDVAILSEALGEAMAPEPYLGLGLLGPQVLLESGHLSKCEEILPSAVLGAERLALADAEEHAPYGGESIGTRAVREGLGFALSGRKTAVLGGSLATIFLVTARTSGSSGERDDVTVFAIPASVEGLHRQDYRFIDGTIASDLTFNAVQIRPEWRVGDPGSAGEFLELAKATAIVATSADIIGCMSGAFSKTILYLHDRKQFGQPISRFQAVRHRVADMAIALEHARSCLYRGLAGLSTACGPERVRAVSTAKVAVAQASRFVCGQSIQLHGGIGLAVENAVARYFRRISVLNSLFGSEDFHLRRLGRLL